jgi:hypothetical protein
MLYHVQPGSGSSIMKDSASSSSSTIKGSYSTAGSSSSSSTSSPGWLQQWTTAEMVLLVAIDAAR